MNITGGGLIDNLPRVIPQGLSAEIKQNAWPRSPLFKRVQESGNMTDVEMIRTFNVGIGMVVIVSLKDAAKTVKQIQSLKINAWPIGQIVKGTREKVVLI